MSEDILDQIDNALADVSACFCGCNKTLTAGSPSPWFASEECQARWGARQLRAKGSIEKAAVLVESAVERLCICPLDPDDAGEPGDPLSTCPVHGWRTEPETATWTVNPDPVRYRCRTCGSWLSLDVALCGPCDARPKCSAASVPAQRVCFLPAGHRVLHEDVEGQRWRVVGRMFEGAPLQPGPGRFTPLGRTPFLRPALDGAMESVTQDLGAALDELVERARRCETCSTEPVAVGFRICRPCLRARGEANSSTAHALPVDAALEHTYRRYECPRPHCDWARVALDLDVFDGMLAQHERAEHATDVRPWWRRMLPGGKR